MNLKASSNRSNMVTSRLKRRAAFGIHDRIVHLRGYRHWKEDVNRGTTSFLWPTVHQSGFLHRLLEVHFLSHARQRPPTMPQEELAEQRDKIRQGAWPITFFPSMPKCFAAASRRVSFE